MFASSELISSPSGIRGSYPHASRAARALACTSEAPLQTPSHQHEEPCTHRVEPRREPTTHIDIEARRDQLEHKMYKVATVILRPLLLKNPFACSMRIVSPPTLEYAPLPRYLKCGYLLLLGRL